MEIEGKYKIGITAGDFNSRNYEYIIKSLSENQVFEGLIPVIYGSISAVEAHKKRIVSSDFHLNPIKQLNELNSKRVNFVNIECKESDVIFGASTEASAKNSLEILEKATNDIKNNSLKALITLPISEEKIQMLNPDFKNQVHYFKQKTQTENVLPITMYADSMKLVSLLSREQMRLATTKITTETVVKKIRLLYESLIIDFGCEKPKIAVLSTGDKMELTEEDKTLLKPAVATLFDEGMPIFGLYDLRTFFRGLEYSKFDAVFILYSDQSDIILNYLQTDFTVTYIGGLPFVHVIPSIKLEYSVDTDISETHAILHALSATLNILRSRAVHSEITKNPLKIEKKEKE